MNEQTLVLVKPDAYMRGLTGRILARLEQRALTIESVRISRSENERIEHHYPCAAAWLIGVGQRTIDDYRNGGLRVTDDYGCDDPLRIGEIIRTQLVGYLRLGPCVPAVVAGNHAVAIVRKLVGHTLPYLAAPGTIRGDYGNDSPDVAARERRPVCNLIHASSDHDEAQREIALWFGNGHVEI